jgi:hypothetical protein
MPPLCQATASEQGEKIKSGQAPDTTLDVKQQRGDLNRQGAEDAKGSDSILRTWRAWRLGGKKEFSGF